MLHHSAVIVQRLRNTFGPYSMAERGLQMFEDRNQLHCWWFPCKSSRLSSDSLITFFITKATTMFWRVIKWIGNHFIFSDAALHKSRWVPLSVQARYTVHFLAIIVVLRHFKWIKNMTSNVCYEISFPLNLRDGTKRWQDGSWYSGVTIIMTFIEHKLDTVLSRSYQRYLLCRMKIRTFIYTVLLSVVQLAASTKAIPQCTVYDL